jgi:hypothetical protein
MQSQDGSHTCIFDQSWVHIECYAHRSQSTSSTEGWEEELWSVGVLLACPAILRNDGRNMAKIAAVANPLLLEKRVLRLFKVLEGCSSECLVDQEGWVWPQTARELQRAPRLSRDTLTRFL